MSEQTQETTERGLRKERIGKVVSDKMSKTVVVSVERLYSHPRYKKFVRRNKNFYAHDEEGRAHVGDTVRIVETRPMSKTKRWRIAAILERAK